MGEDQAKDVAKAIVGGMSKIESMSEIDDSQEIELELRLIHFPRRDVRGVGLEATWGLPPDITQEVCDTVEQRVDLRKAKKGTTTIGTVTVKGSGELSAYDIDSTYLKPTQGQ